MHAKISFYIRSGSLFKFWHVFFFFFFFFFFFNNNVQTKSRGSPNMTRIRILLDQENS